MELLDDEKEKKPKTNKWQVIYKCGILALILLLLGSGVWFYINYEVLGGKYAGSYRCSSWNGKENYIFLSKDHSMSCPVGTGTWKMKDNYLYIELNNTEEKLGIVDKGLLFRDIFFEKIK